MGRAEELFARLQSGSDQEIYRMIDDEVVEELFLDYKQAATMPPYKKLDPADRKNLAKAITGFANSEGGIVVWGVDCRQNPPHGDVPTAARLIENPIAFKSLLEGAITGVTLPAHSGVQTIAIQASKASGGFVVTHVPVGLHVPYRTLGDKEEYYIRAGSNFLPTPHAVLAGLFGRSPHPALSLLVRLQAIQGTHAPQPQCRLALDISVRNSGRGSAEDIFVGAEMRFPSGCTANFAINDNYWNRWRTTKDGRDRLTITSKSFPAIPPGSENEIFHINLDLSPPLGGDILIDLDCGARNGPGAARAVALPLKVIGEALEHFTYNYSDGQAKRAGDAHHRAAISDCLKK